jgi:Asp-tRNA(Asn)/Glu-tRNA(Gln) amidotransferase A subunit family amidase
VARWRRSGAAFTSKTHLNEFAYGITGENRWFGDCTIPGLPDRLTGGSSSGAAASILAGSAGVALGTDTGGSLRVPAALCGLVSYRQSHGFGELDGAFPLAHSFDTVGWIQRNLEEVAWIARQIHPELAIPPLGDSPSIGILKGARLEDVDPAIASAVSDYGITLRSAGATVREVATRDWEEALKLFVPIQAYEAASVHREFLTEHSHEYDPAILGRLQLGLELSAAEYRELQQLRLKFVHDRLLPLFSESEFLLAPATPVRELTARTNHSANRPRLLGLTTPASLGGMPVLTVPFNPGAPGIGFQLIGRPGADTRLWALADWLATRIHDVPG